MFLSFLFHVIIGGPKDLLLSENPSTAMAYQPELHVEGESSLGGGEIFRLFVLDVQT